MEAGASAGEAPARGPEGSTQAGRVLHGAARGVVGAMAMSGMRVVTTRVGLVEETPPRAVARRHARGVRRLPWLAPRGQRMALLEVLHWAVGAVAGAVFGALPRELRDRRWVGPVYGLVVWLGFELGAAPALGLSQARRLRLVDRLALAADHLLYGWVLSGLREGPRD